MTVLACLAVFAPVVVAQTPAPPQLYWTQYVYDSPIDRFSLHRSNLDGSLPVELNHAVTPEPYLGLAVWGDKIFWGSDVATIHAATLDGQELGPWDAPLPQRVRAEALGMAYDEATGATYRAGQAAGGERNIERVDAGGNVTTLIPTDLFPANIGLALDPVGRKLYFGGYADGSGGVIKRANLDGTDVEFVIATLPQDPRSFDLAIDPLGGKMYWTADLVGGGSRGIHRADLDGSNIDDLVIDIPPGVIALSAVVPEPAAGLVALAAGALALRRRRARAATVVPQCVEQLHSHAGY